MSSSNSVGMIGPNQSSSVITPSHVIGDLASVGGFASDSTLLLFSIEDNSTLCQEFVLAVVM